MAIEEAGKKMIKHWETILGFKEAEMESISGIKNELVRKMVKSIGTIMEAQDLVKQIWKDLDKIHQEDDTMIALLDTMYAEYTKSSKSESGEPSKSAESGEPSKSAAESGEPSKSAAESGEPVAGTELTFEKHAAQVFPCESKFSRRNMEITNLMYQLIVTRNGMRVHSAKLDGVIESLTKLSRSLAAARDAELPRKGGIIVKWSTASWNKMISKWVSRDPISAFNVSADGKLLAITHQQLTSGA